MKPFHLVFTLSALLLAALQPPAGLQAWQWQGDELLPAPLPAQLSALAPLRSGDLDGDGVDEHLRLEDGRATILRGAETAWESPTDWHVVQAQLSDLNRDGTLEAVLLLWRPFQPWPVDEHLPNPGRISTFHDRQGNSCHIILIGWFRGAFRERWAGSALAEPLRAFITADLDGDGWDELAVLESFYDTPACIPAGAVAVWEWNGFGFDLAERQRGRFPALAAARSPSGESILLTGK